MGRPACLLGAQASSRCENAKGFGERTVLLLPCCPGQGIWSFPYLYWIVSEVVDARNFVIRILTMLNRNTKLIWKKVERDKGRLVVGLGRETESLR